MWVVVMISKDSQVVKGGRFKLYCSTLRGFESHSLYFAPGKLCGGVETLHAPIAQPVERESYELEAVGSNPTGSTCRPGIGILIVTDISFCHSFLVMGKT